MTMPLYTFSHPLHMTLYLRLVAKSVLPAGLSHGASTSSPGSQVPDWQCSDCGQARAAAFHTPLSRTCSRWQRLFPFSPQLTPSLFAALSGPAVRACNRCKLSLSLFLFALSLSSPLDLPRSACHYFCASPCASPLGALVWGVASGCHGFSRFVIATFRLTACARRTPLRPLRTIFDAARVRALGPVSNACVRRPFCREA